MQRRHFVLSCSMIIVVFFMKETQRDIHILSCCMIIVFFCLFFRLSATERDNDTYEWGLAIAADLLLDL